MSSVFFGYQQPVITERTSLDTGHRGHTATPSRWKVRSHHGAGGKPLHCEDVERPRQAVDPVRTNVRFYAKGSLVDEMSTELVDGLYGIYGIYIYGIYGIYGIYSVYIAYI